MARAVGRLDGTLRGGESGEEARMPNTRRRGLSSAEVAQFHEEGFLVVEDLIPESLRRAVRADPLRSQTGRHHGALGQSDVLERGGPASHRT